MTNWVFFNRSETLRPLLFLINKHPSNHFIISMRAYFHEYGLTHAVLVLTMAIYYLSVHQIQPGHSIQTSRFIARHARYILTIVVAHVLVQTLQI